MELTRSTPAQYVPLVGPTKAAKLKRLGIYTVEDFLYHIPHRYNDYSLVTPISKAQPGEIVTIRATVATISTFRTKNGKIIVQAVVFDDSGKITCTWFNQMYLLRIISAGDEISFSGSIQWFGNKIVLSNPTYEILSSQTEGDTLHTGRLVAVYHETEGITSKWLRNRIHALLKTLSSTIVDELPSHIKQQQQLMDLQTALNAVHFPESLDQAEQAKKRLAFDELFFYQIRAKIQKRDWETQNKAPILQCSTNDKAQFLAQLPFTLTPDQHSAMNQIDSDVSRSVPMNRLLIGDVGSGKTIVAALALYICYKSGYSAVFMAPTQILAEQHFQSIQRLLAPLEIEVDLITGTTKTITKDIAANQRLFSQSSPRLVVGTHALLSQQHLFHKLGLVVIDEQHRFGVKQRGLLTAETKTHHTPHLLTMTATPIPRTLAKTLFGNIDVSFLLTNPKGRQPIKTWLVPNEKREKGYAWIEKQIRETHGQAFIICPFIEASETMTSVKAVTKEYETLKQQFSRLSIGLLHGRMKPKEKTAVLTAFRDKQHHILLATPVVEVGIDIPNATIIVIEAAERFGLSQLHQLRGRVGRGEKQSYCLLYTEMEDERTLLRLKAMETIHNGPELAEVDLHLRGAGDVFGTRQHGIPLLKVASLLDNALLEATKAIASSVLDEDPDLTRFPLLRQMVKNSIIESVND